MTDIRQQTIGHLLAGLDEHPKESRHEAVEKLLGLEGENEHLARWGDLILEKPGYSLEAFGEPRPDMQESEEEEPGHPPSPLVLGTYTLGFHRLANPKPGIITPPSVRLVVNPLMRGSNWT